MLMIFLTSKVNFFSPCDERTKSIEKGERMEGGGRKDGEMKRENGGAKNRWCS